MNEVEEVINQFIEKLEENERIIKVRQKQLNNLIQNQEEKFLKVAEKIKPIIYHIKSQGYAFKNTHFNCQSYEGPIVGYQDSQVFIYVGGRYLQKRTLTDEEAGLVPLDHFLSENSFKYAMEGLLETVQIQDNMIREYQKDIDNGEAELSEFKHY
ncbi:hypothetical protein ACQKMY_25855 [Peribacillus frigoritolerans]|uniref:hypothetical protein n=1 Tax=Peribacillus frigoritolerans TaxID=450367 RepID=UPI003CFD8D67